MSTTLMEPESGFATESVAADTVVFSGPPDTAREGTPWPEPSGPDVLFPEAGFEAACSAVSIK